MTTLADQEMKSPYRRFTWQEALVDYLPVRWQTPVAFKWVNRVPTIVVLLLMSLLALRLRNSVFIDEALYINAGQDYLNGLLRGAPVPRHGEYFSGAPAVYPVLAAALDSVGGLYLVRLFSLICMMLTVLAVQDTAQALFSSRRAGLLAGVAFAFTGSVIFVGAFATFDALCMLSLATALWLGIKKASMLSAVGVGLALTLAVTVKYTGAVFVPIVLGLIFLAGRRPIARCAVAVATAAAVLIPTFLIHGESLLPGIKFTTSARAALSPTTTSNLLIFLALNIGVLAIFALIGGVRHARSLRTALVVLGLLAGAALLPVAQLRIGEAVSFDKHTAYAALFLAPLAGKGLATMSRGLLKLAPVFLFSLVMLIAGLSRSGTLYQGWVNLSPVLEVIEAEPRPGLYMSSSADSLKYYTRKKHPDVRWQTTFNLYAQGEEAIRVAIEDNRFQMVIIRSGSTGSSIQDTGQRVLEEAVKSNPSYELARKPFPVQRYSTEAWYVYRLVPDAANKTPRLTTYESDSTGSTR